MDAVAVDAVDAVDTDAVAVDAVAADVAVDFVLDVAVDDEVESVLLFYK